MKTLATTIAILLLNFTAQADQQIMKDSGSAQLAKILAGHALVCDSLGNKSQEAAQEGLLPLTLTAEAKKAGETVLTVTTKDPKVGFGFGGNIFDNTEITPSWIIISEGDDGRRHLFIQNFHLEGSNGSYKCAGHGGDIAGVLSEIWDAGTISSRGVQCCVK